MNVEEFKRNLQNIFGEQIRFSVDFDSYTEEIKNIDDDFIGWCLQLKEKKIDPIPAKRKYRDHLVFVKKIGSSNRCIVIKIKNGEFKEVHLGDHDYYNQVMKELGLKKRSKTY